MISRLLTPEWPAGPRPDAFRLCIGASWSRIGPRRMHQHLVMLGRRCRCRRSETCSVSPVRSLPAMCAHCFLSTLFLIPRRINLQDANPHLISVSHSVGHPDPPVPPYSRAAQLRSSQASALPSTNGPNFCRHIAWYAFSHAFSDGERREASMRESWIGQTGMRKEDGRWNDGVS